MTLFSYLKNLFSPNILFFLKEKLVNPINAKNNRKRQKYFKH